jgi:hypothetical protein
MTAAIAVPLCMGSRSGQKADSNWDGNKKRLEGRHRIISIEKRDPKRPPRFIRHTVVHGFGQIAAFRVPAR